MRYIALVHLFKQRKQAQKIIEFLPRNSKFVILKPRHTTIHPTPKRLQSLKLWNMERYLFSLHKTRSPTMSFWNWKWGMENAKNVIENWRRISNRIKKIIKFHNNNSVLCLRHDNIVRSLLFHSIHSITCIRTSLLCILIFCMIKFPPLIGICRDLSDLYAISVLFTINLLSLLYMKRG